MAAILLAPVAMGGLMKMTVEIPDAIFRRAKSRAAKRGISLRQFVIEAVAARLQGTSAKNAGRDALPASGYTGATNYGKDSRPWMKHFGKLKHLRQETRRINKIIEDVFER
jgi:hypothetical protein